MQLFALLVKQDGGMLASEREYVETFLRKQLSQDSVEEYIILFDKHSGPVIKTAPDTEDQPPSVKDSVKIFSICKTINRTLNQSQKVVVLMRLYELVNADKRYTLQRMNIINTVSEVFRINKDEFKGIDEFVKLEEGENTKNPLILIFDHKLECPECDDKDNLADNIIMVLQIASIDLYFIKHYSHNQLFLNGLPLLPRKVYTIPKGSSLRYLMGQPIYYSDIASHFLAKEDLSRISFVTKDLSYLFHGHKIGINKINISEKEGSLVGIMGSSGTGKTTLLNLMSGMTEPSSGSVQINGIDIHRNKEMVEGVMGYVPQDDLLIEDLTIFENLYYAAALCFRSLSRLELTQLVDKTLLSLGLFDKRDLRVGSPLNKVISGGQRKRLNIALELIREPSVMFLDEPTSGLSSRDSENVMDLLRELTFKGKLIITVIHQPSSEIYKMFDKMIILDHGGEMIYYGNPVEALIHFKTLDSQIDSSIGECPACGNINPEAIFNIVETEVVDEFGKYTGKRKTTPGVWAKYFSDDHPPGEVTKVKESPPSNLNIPSIFKQWRIFSKRDFISKLANKQYVLLTLLEAPVLGFMLAYIIRYIADPSSNIYIFRENENIPIYIFMSLIVALFLGLITSAEEIYKDKKILKREYFLHLSRKSYLLAKIGNLFIISAIQALLFVAIANPVLGIKGLHIQYWLAFFTTAACANLIGLNISASFNSAITIYIIVPIIMIPMMVLSGAMFPFDKLNRTIGSVERVPFLAEIIPTRWTYEALMVTQAKDNHYDILVYETDKIISEADFNTTYRLPELKTALNNTVLAYRKKELSEENPAKLNLIYNEFRKIAESNKTEEFENTNKLNPTEFNHIIAEEAQNYIDHLIALYTLSSNSAFIKKDKFISLNKEALDMLFNNYHNNKLEDIVEKRYEVHKIINYKDNLIQNTDPIYYTPENRGPLNFRTHFFAPTKPIIGMQADTFFFNIIIVWLMTISLYFILYFELLRRLINTLLDND